MTHSNEERPRPRGSLAPGTAERWHLERLYRLPPGVFAPGTRVNTRRMHNMVQGNVDEARGAERVRAFPVKLTIEATNLCSLRCPGCFTGAGERGRESGHLSMDTFRKIMAELAPYLFEVEFFNWGEPLLARNLFPMIAEAHLAGVSTTISTSFSVPFDDEDANHLVRSGLSLLGVSIDGARQETYEMYRRRGSFQRVIDNCRRVVRAKQRLGSTTPELVWMYHVFPHNTEDIEPATRLANEIGMRISIKKGWVRGGDWDQERRFPSSFGGEAFPTRCTFLWHRAVVNNDGGVAPCCGSFYREDDLGRIEPSEADEASRSFMDVWNGPKAVEARGFYRSRSALPEHTDHVCFECPATVQWERWVTFLLSNGLPGTFDNGFHDGSGGDYFWTRAPARSDTAERLLELRRRR